MDKKKDLKDIKVGGPAFKSDWWNKRCSSKCKKEGVDKALDAWSDFCKDPEKFEESDELGKAKMACNGLRTALGKAKSKCGKLQGDTKAAIEKYLDVIGGYEKDLAAKEKEFEADEAEAKNLVKALKQTRQRQMFYGLVRKGKEGRLFVSKKQQPIKRLARKAKSTEIKGAIIFLGVCDFAEGKLRFHFEEKPPNLKPVLRTLLADAGMKPAIFVNGEEISYPEDETDLPDEALEAVGGFFSGVERQQVEEVRSSLEQQRVAAIKGVSQLQNELLSTGDHRATQIADIIKQLALNFPTALETLLADLRDAIDAEDDDQTEMLKGGIQMAAAQWATFLSSNADSVAGCENNPWGVKIEIVGPVRSSLQEAVKLAS
ncbi:hypothetical protein Mal4_55930 [Maioricimonas rarisocia]|uniref:Uncharacterized protein n=1 Tax=Maioricimonas rarisocia TaxID=2528026 RepID=A0A517ZFH0_9PLAN|nr:hypothetical protein [Maioricimonas rarisocia]QDU41228.1 hypothetical protein Mal4_55930 [Maioricimonas rarisocia]